jgi:hypothetical protein
MSQMLTVAIEGLPTALLSLAAIVVAAIVLRRSWLVAFLLFMGGLVSLVAYTLSIAFLPVYGIFIGLSLGNLIRPRALALIESTWFAIQNLVGATSSALLLAAAVVAVAGWVRSSRKRRPARASPYAPHPYQLPPQH